MRLGSITPVTEWNQKQMVTFSSLAVGYGQSRRMILEEQTNFAYLVPKSTQKGEQ